MENPRLVSRGSTVVRWQREERTPTPHEQTSLHQPPSRRCRQVDGFFSALGYATNPEFTVADAACLVINDTIFIMLLSHAKGQGMTTKAICDARKSAEV